MVVGPIQERRRVGLGAGLFEQAVELSARVIQRAAEHQVLEEVGDSCFTGLVVARADREPELKANDGGAVVFEEQDSKAVAEGEMFDAHRRSKRDRRDVVSLGERGPALVQLG